MNAMLARVFEGLVLMFKVRYCIVGAIMGAVLWLGPSQAAGQTAVVVFNFQMKSKTPDWIWLEKCLADQITTDLHQVGGLSVIARDSMQAVAQEIAWAPEMATGNAGKMGVIKKTLEIEYLISGVCTIENEDITITGQIVDVAKRMEQFRKAVSGKLANVIGLQKQLSAELLSWFTKRSADKILPTLPVWTGSIPAIRALYEGMDLYDQGRYAEGWLKFRQASRADTEYIEAIYWVGKMYYFMDRYQHARRSIEQFVYMDEKHPRVTDAIIEYLHTFERTTSSPDELLELYAAFRKRFADVVVPWDVGKHPNYTTNYGTLIGWKMARLLEDNRRPKEALDLFWNRHEESFRRINAIARTRCQLLNRLLTGRSGVKTPNGQTYDFTAREFLVAKVPDHRVVTGTSFRSASMSFIRDAPDGFYIKSFRLFLTTKMNEGTVTLAVAKNAADDVAVQTVTIKDAVRKGVLFDTLPRCGRLRIRCTVKGEEEFEDQYEILTQLRSETRYTKIGPFGLIDVTCGSSADFSVFVDDRLGRSGAGLVGGISPGQHVLWFRPLKADSPYTEWKTTVTVKEGETTKVHGKLNWKAGSPLQGWSLGGDVVGSYANECVEFGEFVFNMRQCVLAEREALRVVWAAKGDLWWSLSTDGVTFSRARKIDIPVSSAWGEKNVDCIRDESGRYVLVFSSDRNARHKDELYVSWSRDFINWSAPAAIRVGASHRWRFHLFLTSRGKVGLVTPRVDGRRSFLTFHVSDDLLEWKPTSRVPWKRWSSFSRPVQREDGAFEMFFMLNVHAPMRKEGKVEGAPADREWHYTYRLQRFTSSDGMIWGDPKTIYEFKTWKIPALLSSGRYDGRSAVYLTDQYSHYYLKDRTSTLFREASDGTWEMSEFDGAFAEGEGQLLYHPQWGYVVSWHDTGATEGPLFAPQSGPYIIHGSGLDGLTYAKLSDEPTRLVGKKPPPAPSLPEGQLSYVVPHPEDYSVYYIAPLIVKGNDKFKKRSSRMKALTSRAVVTAVKSGSDVFHFAMDYSNPKWVHPDILLADFSGTGKFKDAVVVKRTSLQTRKPDANGQGGSLTARFDNKDLAIKYKGETRRIRFYTYFNVSRGTMEFNVWIGYCAQATCRFGDDSYPVRFYESTGTLHPDDPTAMNAPTRNGLPRGDIIRVVPTGRIIHEMSRFAADGALVQSKTAVAYAGHPILVDNKLYTVTLSKETKTVNVSPFAGKMGMIRINHSNWAAWFRGKKHLVHVRGGTEPVPLPADSYDMICYLESVPTGPGTVWVQRLKRSPRLETHSETSKSVTITANKTTELAYGSPVTAWVQGRQRDGAIHFSAHMVGVDGTAVDHAYWTTTPASTPRVAIIDLKGREIAIVEMVFAHCLERYWSLKWPIPEGLGGTYTARLVWTLKDFTVKTKDTTFVIR